MTFMYLNEFFLSIVLNRKVSRVEKPLKLIWMNLVTQSQNQLINPNIIEV